MVAGIEFLAQVVGGRTFNKESATHMTVAIPTACGKCNANSEAGTCCTYITSMIELQDRRKSSPALLEAAESVTPCGLRDKVRTFSWVISL